MSNNNSKEKMRVESTKEIANTNKGNISAKNNNEKIQ
jgi:hypothetical protein